MIKALFDSAWPKVRRYIRSQSGSLEQAEDLFHDVVIKLMLKFRKGELGDLVEVDGYVFVMAKNLWFTRLKRNKKIQFVDYVLDREEPTHVDNSQQLSQLVSSALEQVGDLCKQLLRLTYFENASLKTVAETLDLSTTDIARTYHYRCKKKLLKVVKGNQEIKDLLSGL